MTAKEVILLLLTFSILGAGYLRANRERVDQNRVEIERLSATTPTSHDEEQSIFPEAVLQPGNNPSPAANGSSPRQQD